MKLRDAFFDFPQKTFDFYKKVKSQSGKSTTSTLAVPSLKVFFQHDSALDPSMIIGQNATAWVELDLLNNNTISVGDKLENATYVVDILLADLQDSSPDIEPFYELALKITYK